MVKPNPSIPVQNQQVHQAQQHQRVHLDYDIRTLLSLDLEFEQLGYIFKRSKLYSYNCHDGPQLNNRGFREAFGCSSRECSLAWLLVADGWTNRPKQATKIRFLWALSLLKTYDTETNMANSCGVDEKTFRKWAWFFIQELSFRIGDIVSKLSSVLLSSYLFFPIVFIFFLSFFLSFFFFTDCLGKPICK